MTFFADSGYRHQKVQSLPANDHDNPTCEIAKLRSIVGVCNTREVMAASAESATTWKAKAGSQNRNEGLLFGLGPILKMPGSWQRSASKIADRTQKVTCYNKVLMLAFGERL